jgi:5-methylcytosine-specific restriction endonuclease McrA
MSVGFIPNISIPDSIYDTRKTCKGCGVKFRENSPSQKFCTEECRENSWRSKHCVQSSYAYVSYYKRCGFCDNWFVASRHQYKYCSSGCRLQTYPNRSKEDIFDLVETEYYFEKYNWTCFICGEKHKPSELACHHVIPIALGGSSEEGNIVVLCHQCHYKQHTKEIWSKIRKDNSCALGLLYDARDKYLQYKTTCGNISISNIESKKVDSIYG